MIAKVKLIFKKWYQSVIELLVFFPVLFLIGIYAIPDHMLWLWFGFISLLYLLGITVGHLFQKRPRIISVLVGAVITGSGVCFLFDRGVTQVVSWILGTAAFIRGVQLRVQRWEDIFPLAGLWIGLIEYFIGYFFFTRLDGLKPFSLAFGWIGIIYMVIMLFTLNFIHLKSASLPGDREPVIPGTIKKHNRLLISVMLIIVGIISFFNSLREGLNRLLSGIGHIVWKFLAFLSELLAPTTSQEQPDLKGGDFEELLPPVKEKSPSIFWDKVIEILGSVMAIVAGLAFLGLLVYIIYKLFKKLVAWLSRFYQLGKEMEYYGAYIDEKESLMDLKELGKNYVNRFQQWLAALMEREPKWDELKSNKERIRYIYRHFLISCIAAGYSFKEYLSPAEIGRELSQRDPEKSRDIEELTVAYQQVRYGEKDVADEKIEKLANVFLKDN